MFITQLNAYDCLDTVVYALTVEEYASDGLGSHQRVFDLRGSFPGRGEDLPESYLARLFEELSKSL